MITEVLDNVTINSNYRCEKNDDEIIITQHDKFKATIIIDNVTHYHYKCYKLTVDKIENGEKLFTIYSEVTKISCNIVLPNNKKALVIINDAFW